MWRQERSGLYASRIFHPQGGGLNRKRHKRNMTFWPLNSYLKRFDWKIWLAGRLSEDLTSNLRNKVNTCCQSLQKWSETELCSPPPPSYGFIKNLWQIHLRYSHIKFRGGGGGGECRQYQVRKITQLGWSKTAKQFSVNSRKKFLCQSQASRQADKPSLGL